MDLVGYKLIDDETGMEVSSWGGVWGQCPSIPNPLILPTGLNHVHCVSPDTTYEDFDGKLYHLAPWMMDEPPAAPEKSASQKLADFLAANPDVLAAIEAMK